MRIKRRGWLIGFLVFMSLSFVWTQDVAQGDLGEADKHVKAGNSLFDRGSYEEAIKEYEAAVQVAPSWYEPHYELGSTYTELKKTDEAQKQYEIAIQQKQDCWLCYQGLGTLADNNGKPLVAVDYYQKAIELAPTRGQPRYNLAITYRSLNRFDEAVSALKEAERVEPRYASPYFLLGKIYYRQGKFYLAQDQLFQATKLETKGKRFDDAKKLIDVQITVEERLPPSQSAFHMAYCISRAGAMAPEEYRKRFPSAETYVENLQEEEYVLGTFATIVDEMSRDKKDTSSDFRQLVVVNKAGYLVPYILSYSSERFPDDLKTFEEKNPGKMAEFRGWAAQKKISLEPVRPQCEVRWMGQVW